MRRSLTIVVFSLLLTFCSKKKELNPGDVCGVKDPLNNITWLKDKLIDLKKESLSGQVLHYRYNSEDVIIIQTWIQSCYPCNMYTCTGRQITHNDDADLVKNILANLDKIKPIGEF